MKMERADSMAMFGVEGPIQMAGIGEATSISAQDRAIFTPGAPRWYALRVAPQREDQAEAWLKRRGVYAFHPVLLRRSVRFGKAVEFQRRYLPGYVFARFKGEPITHRVCTCPFILGALARQSGTWGILEPSRLQPLHAMRQAPAGDAARSAAERVSQQKRADEARRLAERMRLRRRNKIRVGDSALFSGKAFAGLSCELVELSADGGVKVRMALFGGDVLVGAHIEDLSVLPKTC